MGLFILAFVCFFATLGGVLLGNSLKAMLIFKEGLEKGQRKMFRLGLTALLAALVLAFASLLLHHA